MLKSFGLLIFSLLVFFSKVNATEPIDEQIATYDDDTFCLFTYGGWVMASEMQGDVPSAQFLGPARLPQYRLDFNIFSDDLQGNFPTVVYDCGYEVWGAIYSIPMTELDLVLTKGGRIDDQSEYQFIQVAVDTRQGSLQCNTFIQVNYPEKLIYGLPIPVERRPSKLIINMLVEAYTDSGLPPRYVEEISQLPIIDEGIIETNLTPVPIEPVVISEPVVAQPVVTTPPVVTSPPVVISPPAVAPPPATTEPHVPLAPVTATPPPAAPVPVAPPPAAPTPVAPPPAAPAPVAPAQSGPINVSNTAETDIHVG